MLKDFSSHGVIDVTTRSDTAAAYGIYAAGAKDTKTSVYNAMGYNSTGDIKVRNTSGGSAFGIYSAARTYNAFRSSAIYGDSVATGNIDMTIEGYSSLGQQVAGIYAAGNAFNSYANSGSDVMLETIGNITINDKAKPEI